MTEGEAVAALFRRRDDCLAAITAIDRKLFFEHGIKVVGDGTGWPRYERVIPTEPEHR